tara:strand:- start:474 stop:1937 length:1464 start_codon:yes stop_codon:yes gene_type:complete
MRKTYLLIALLVPTIFNAQGVSIDQNFGTNGITEMPFDSSGNDLSSCVLLSSGKILFLSTKINGSNQNEVFLCRLDSNGAIDNTFGNNGFAYPNLQYYHGNFIKVQTDDKILIYGGSNPAKLIRLNSDGSYDMSFATNGIFELPTNSYHSEDDSLFSGNNLLIQNNGSIILRYVQGLNGVITLKKIDSNGIADNSFGTNSTITNISSKGIFISNDSKIIGFSSTTTNYTIEKFNLNGTIDSTFGTNGTMTINLPYTDFETKFIKQDDLGRLLVHKFNFNTTPALLFDAFRLNSNGTIDTTFGTNGYISFSDFQIFIVSNVLVDNNYYFGGATIESNDIYNLFIIKYHENGTLNTNFNNLGYKIENTNNTKQACESINIQTDGKILVSGESENGSTKKLFLMRYVDQNLSMNTFNTNSLKIINPINETITIDSEDEIEKISIIGTDGKLIIETKRKLINTSKLSKGIYILNLKFKNENKVYTNKIIKK